MLRRTLTALFLLFFTAPAYADDGHQPQWQFEPDQRIYGEIPRDQCIRAIYLTDTVREETGYDHWEMWLPPISENTASWLDWHRGRGNLYVVLCENSPT